MFALFCDDLNFVRMLVTDVSILVILKFHIFSKIGRSRVAISVLQTAHLVSAWLVSHHANCKISLG